jgi:hypothetical protein
VKIKNKKMIENKERMGRKERKGEDDLNKDCGCASGKKDVGLRCVNYGKS